VNIVGRTKGIFYCTVLSSFYLINAIDSKDVAQEMREKARMAEQSSLRHKDMQQKAEQLNALVHPVWPATDQRGAVDLMVTCPNYEAEMVMFVVSMIPGTSELQSQSLHIGKEKRSETNYGMALLKADTGYRIYLTTLSKMQAAIEYLSAYKQGIRYNTFGQQFINPLSGNQMMFVASFNPEFGTPLPGSVDEHDGLRTIHVALPPYALDRLQAVNYMPQENNPQFIFGQ